VPPRRGSLRTSLAQVAHLLAGGSFGELERPISHLDRCLLHRSDHRMV